MKLQGVFPKVYLPFACCREKDDKQQRLAALLADVICSSTVRVMVASDFLCLPKGLGHLQFIANRYFWCNELSF